MSKSFRDAKGKADEEDAAASDLQETEVLRDTATVSMLEEIGNYSLPSSTVTSSSNLEESVLHTPGFGGSSFGGLRYLAGQSSKATQSESTFK